MLSFNTNFEFKYSWYITIIYLPVKKKNNSDMLDKSIELEKMYCLLSFYEYLIGMHYVLN